MSACIGERTGRSPRSAPTIAKTDGRQRPLGIAALEDKLVQQAVAVVLSQVYEADFLGFSYGFRPGRGQHDALDALSVALVWQCVSWVLMPTFRASLIPWITAGCCGFSSTGLLILGCFGSFGSGCAPECRRTARG